MPIFFSPQCGYDPTVYLQLNAHNHWCTIKITKGLYLAGVGASNYVLTLKFDKRSYNIFTLLSQIIEDN